MKDDPETYKKFVKIVEQFPEVYNETLDAYKNAKTQNKYWAKIADCVREELKEKCTAQELKLKWRGIRMSSNWMFKRYNIEHCEPNFYYLYDSIKFLEPFLTNPTDTLNSSSTSAQKQSSEKEASVTPIPEGLEFEELDLKPEVVDIDDDDDTDNAIEENQEILKEYLENNECRASASKKARYENPVQDKTKPPVDDFENDDMMLFFRSMLPDVKDFTPKEKRQFKIGVLGLVDVIQGLRPTFNGTPNS
ncbi:hypothetical protein O0L34_g4579 [Tuta absoluta]|nr:hypothetical protein O0L34_g4579 [Tuta absoluta]